MRCFAVSFGAVHYDSTVCVVSFDIAGTMNQKVGIALAASTFPPPQRQFVSTRHGGMYVWSDVNGQEVEKRSNADVGLE